MKRNAKERERERERGERGRGREGGRGKGRGKRGMREGQGVTGRQGGEARAHVAKAFLGGFS